MDREPWIPHDVCNSSSGMMYVTVDPKKHDSRKCGLKQWKEKWTCHQEMYCMKLGKLFPRTSFSKYHL